MEFTDEQKIKLLKKWGYELRPVKVTVTFTYYHNQVDREEKEIIGVFKDGKPMYKEPYGYEDPKEDHWVHKIFDEQVNKRLYKLLEEL